MVFEETVFEAPARAMFETLYLAFYVSLRVGIKI